MKTNRLINQLLKIDRLAGCSRLLKRHSVWMAIACFWFAFISPAFAADLDSGKAVFEARCIGCHVNGGNIVRRNKTLKQKALEKFEMNSIEAIEAIVTNGKNSMSAYKDKLTEEQIQAVAAYVLDRAAADWR